MSFQAADRQYLCLTINHKSCKDVIFITSFSVYVRQLLALWDRRHWQPWYKQEWKVFSLYQADTKLHCCADLSRCSGVTSWNQWPHKDDIPLNGVKGQEVAFSHTQAEKWPRRSGSSIVHVNQAIKILQQLPSYQVLLASLLFLETLAVLSTHVIQVGLGCRESLCCLGDLRVKTALINNNNEWIPEDKNTARENRISSFLQN